jgi:hypothetical protein
LDEALVDRIEDAVTAGAGNMETTHICDQALQRYRSALEADEMEELAANEVEEVSRESTDDAVLRAHEQSASLSLRKRGAAGFWLSNPESSGDPDSYLAYKARQLDQARRRVLSDADLQELLRWSASTGKPLNLRGCNLSGANLRNASLRGACLAFTNATGADTHGVDLTGADLEDSRGWERPLVEALVKHPSSPSRRRWRLALRRLTRR